MEACTDGNGENDSHIISLMGTSDLNLVDTSMLPSDPRAMMDLVRSGEQDDDSLSTAFQTHFQQSSNGHPLPPMDSVAFANNGHLPSNSSPLSALTCSVSLSSASISALIRPTSPTLECAASPVNPPLHSPLGGHTLHPIGVPQQQRVQQSLPILQIGLTSPSQGSTHSSQGVSSPPLDNGGDTISNNRNSNHGGSSSLQQTMVLPLHTPPLHQQTDFSPYFTGAQTPSSMTLTRNYPGNGFVSGGGFTFTSSHPHPHSSLPQPSPLSPDHHQQHQHPPQSPFVKRDGLMGVYIVPHLKREPEEDFKQEMGPDGVIKRPHSADSLNLDQPPYVSFANLNLNTERSIVTSGGANLRISHRNPSGEGNLAQSPLISPMRPPSGNDAVCTSPNEIVLSTRVPTQSQPHQQPYGLASPPQMILESPRGPHAVPVHQQQPLQPHLFQSIQLHNTALTPQHSQLHPQDVPLTLSGAHQPVSLNLNTFEDSLNNDPLTSATRNLSFNYNEIMGPQTGINNSHSLFVQGPQYPIKTGSAKHSNRRSSASSYRRKEEEEEEGENYSSDSALSNNESDDEALVIDTSGSSTEGYECGECKQVCRTRGSLRKHLATEHFPNEPEPAETIFKDYSCPLSMCNYVTTHRDEYDKHLADHISDGWTPTGKKRHNKNPLQRHRYNKEEFRCPHCDYSCTVEKAFNRHLAAHENGQEELELADKVSCQICGKDRPTDAALRIHMKKHRKGKYYKCDICKFKSVQLKKLIQHRRMHTGEKPHLCPYCVYRAARRDNLRSHVRRMHKKNNMFCDTFTPRPLIVAQVEANQGAISHSMHHHQQPQPQPQQQSQQQQPHHHHHQQPHQQEPQQQQQQQQRPMMSLNQHPSGVQHPLMDRMQQHHHHQQMSPQGMSSLPPQGLGVGAISPQEIGGVSSQEHIHLSQGGVLILPPPHSSSQHNLLPSPPTQ